MKHPPPVLDQDSICLIENFLSGNPAKKPAPELDDEEPVKTTITVQQINDFFDDPANSEFNDYYAIVSGITVDEIRASLIDNIDEINNPSEFINAGAMFDSARGSMKNALRKENR